jgi:hypothetical protein
MEERETEEEEVEGGGKAAIVGGLGSLGDVESEASGRWSVMEVQGVSFSEVRFWERLSTEAGEGPKAAMHHSVVGRHGSNDRDRMTTRPRNRNS